MCTVGVLLKASERSNITIRVIPFSAGWFPYSGSSVLYASGVVPQLDTVQADVANGAAFVDTPSHLANYARILDRIFGGPYINCEGVGMTAVHWQKSSYSTDHGNCVEPASSDEAILLRESDIPATVLMVARTPLRSLLFSVKADHFEGPGHLALREVQRPGLLFRITSTGVR